MHDMHDMHVDLRENYVEKILAPIKKCFDQKTVC